MRSVAYRTIVSWVANGFANVARGMRWFVLLPLVPSASRGTMLLLAIVYYVSAKVTFWPLKLLGFDQAIAEASPVYLAAGVGAVMVYVHGMKGLCVIFGVELITGNGLLPYNSLYVGLTFAACGSFRSWMFACLFRQTQVYRKAWWEILTNENMILGCFALPLMIAFVTNAVAWAMGHITDRGFCLALCLWYVGDVLGLLFGLPFLIRLSRRPYLSSPHSNRDMFDACFGILIQEQGRRIDARTMATIVDRAMIKVARSPFSPPTRAAAMRAVLRVARWQFFLRSVRQYMF